MSAGSPSNAPGARRRWQQKSALANVQYNQASAAAGGLVGLALLVGLGFLVKRKASSAGLSSMLRRKGSTFKSFDNDLNQ